MFHWHNIAKTNIEHHTKTNTMIIHDEEDNNFENNFRNQFNLSAALNQSYSQEFSKKSIEVL